jgi:leucyl aminopeptidase (aminopeptidase T)
MLPSYPEATRRGLARNLLRNSLRLKRGENLLIETWSATLPWAQSAVVEARILGARPLLVVEDEESYWASFGEAPSGNLEFTGSHEWAALKESDAYLEFLGPMDTSKAEARPAAILNRIRANEHEWLRLIHKFRVRSVRWDLGRTSALWARRYHVNLARWRKVLIEAAAVDPGSLRKAGNRLAQPLRLGHLATITHPNGTHLTLRLAGRQPRVDDGIVDEEVARTKTPITVVPSGVVGVAVDETTADGVFLANTTGTLFTHEREAPIRGRWSFRQGRLADYSLTMGSDFFRQEIHKVGAENLTPGLLSIGLNPKISAIPLLFDQEKGTITFEIGRNINFGGRTRTPHVYAYQAIRGATLKVDGQTLVRGGRILE